MLLEACLSFLQVGLHMYLLSLVTLAVIEFIDNNILLCEYILLLVQYV